MRPLFVLTLALALGSGCAPKSVVRPSGPRAPLTDGAALLDAATSACRRVRTLTAELQISGRVGRQKLRGRAIVGAAEPASLRLEGVAPFGQPAFILVARDGRGTLLLPRDRRVLADQAPERILEALTGVSVAPAALRSLLAGCFLPSAPASGGERYGDRWAVLAFGGEAGQAYLRRDGAEWRLVASTAGSISVEYDEFSGSRPQRVRIRTAGTTLPPAELTLVVSQVEMNVDVPSEAFEVKVPADADPLTLDELRAGGPLGAREKLEP